MKAQLSCANNKKVLALLEVNIPFNKVWVIDDCAIVIVHDPKRDFEAVCIQIDDVLAVEVIFRCFNRNSWLLSVSPFLEFLDSIDKDSNPHNYRAKYTWQCGNAGPLVEVQ